MAKTHPSVIALGPNKGHPFTQYKAPGKAAQRPKQASRKGRIGKRPKLIRQVIAEVSGVSTYEKRIVEFLKAGSLKDTKRALRTAKKALGTHRRAKLKRESIMAMLELRKSLKPRRKRRKLLPKNDLFKLK